MASSWFVHLRRWIGRLLFAAVLVLAVLVVVARQLLQMLPDLQDQVLAQVNAHLPWPVAVERLEGDMVGLRPSLRVTGLTLTPVEGTQAPLAIRQLEFTLNPWLSLWERQPVLDSLRIAGLRVELEKRPGEGVRLRGLDAFDTPDAAGGSRLLQHLYRQRHVLLEDVQARMQWEDLPPMESRDLTLALLRQRDTRRVAVRFGAADGSFRVDLRAELMDRAERWQELEGQVYLLVSGEGLEQWVPASWPFAVRPVSAAGTLELWAQLEQGQPATATALVATRDVTLRHAQGQDWTLEAFDSHFQLQREEQGYRLVLGALQARTREQGALTLGPLALWWDGQPLQDAAWRLRAERVSATGLRNQLLAWPFPLEGQLARLREGLLDLAPQGDLKALYLSGQGAGPEHFSARFDQLGVNAGDQRPGVSGVSGWLAGTAAEGILWLDAPALAATFPAHFDESLAFALTGPLHWQGGVEQGWTLRSGRLLLANDDARGEALLTLQRPLDGPVRLALRGDLQQGRVARVARYVPLRRVPDAARRWLEQAFVDGRVDRARFLWEGPLVLPPERAGERTFQMLFDLDQTELHVLPGWPHVRDLQGQVALTNLVLSGQLGRGRFLDADLSGIRVALTGLGPDPDPPHLAVAGAVRATATDLQRLFWESPLAEVLPEPLAAWTLAGGQLDGHLELEQPLVSGGRTALAVSGRATGVRLDSASWRLRARNLDGQVRFSLARGLELRELRGELNGQPVTGRLDTRSDAMLLSLKGQMSLAAVRDWLGQSWLEPLEGRTPFQAELSLPRGAGPVRLALNAPMTGVASRYPAPLDRTGPLELVYRRDQGAQSLRADLSGLGGLQLALTEAGQVLRGGVRLGAGHAVLPPQGLVVEGRASRLDLNGWVELIADDQGPFRRQGEGPPLPLLQLALDGDDFRVGAQTLGAGRLAIRQRPSGDWQLALSTRPVAGELYIPGDFTLRGTRPLMADLAHLHYPFQTVPGMDVEAVNWSERTPHRIPVADFSVRDLQLYGQSLGDWQGQVRPQPEGVRVEGLQGLWGRTDFSGSFSWLQQGEHQESLVQGLVRSRDLAALLGRFGVERFAESEEAQAQLSLSWARSPFQVALADLRGEVDLDLADTTLYASEKHASALRMLGLLNVGNNLSRRLRLDFSDVASDGLLADRIRGHFVLGEQRLRTERLRIRSASAEFDIRGELDLAARNMDYRVEVTLPLSSNLYAGCLAGPAACAGIFVVERLWGNRLEKMTSMVYRVQGPWDSAQVEDAVPVVPTEEETLP